VQDIAEVAAGFFVVGLDLQGFFDLGFGLFEAAFTDEGTDDFSARLGKVRRGEEALGRRIDGFMD
jgi:hypothetical protein